MANIYDLSDTWNASGTTFTAIKLNVTDSASAAASLLMDLQVGGVSKLIATKGGRIKPVDYGAADDGDMLFYRGSTVAGRIGTTISTFAQAVGIGLGAGSASSPIIRLEADAANTLAQRNGVNAQTSRLYGTYTDASNYRRLTKTMSTGGVAEIKPEGAGTGASGNVLHISGLPTSNPGAGILWNNLGAVVVGT
jgi:hypothetical protein